jgi:hypothetical protein
MIKWRRIRRREVRLGGLNRLALLLLASIVLLFDAVVIGRHAGLIRLPGELDSMDMARAGARVYADLSYALLERDEPSGVGSAGAVLAGAAQRLVTARTREDVGRELAGLASELHRAVRTDRAQEAGKRVAEILASDPQVASYKGPEAYILITASGTDARVEDRQGVLSRATVTAISSDPIIARAPDAIEIGVESGRVSFDPVNPMARAAALSGEIANLVSSITRLRADSGFGELSGPGIVALAYDAASGYAWDEIVHQKDVLDILNALFAAGALGAQVGNERIVAVSSVRCIGPIVLVNQRPVAVNPIRIYAVGDGNALSRSLAPIASRFARTGKRLEITRESDVRLAAYRKGEVPW